MNRETPIVLSFPDLAETHDGLEDVLSRKGVEADLKGMKGIELLFGKSVDEFAGAVGRYPDAAASGKASSPVHTHVDRELPHTRQGHYGS